MKNIRKHSCVLSLLFLVISFGDSEARGESIRQPGGAPLAGVLLGPCGSAAAEGPSGTNDDFTNLSIGSGVAAVGELTTSPASAVFKNTVANTGSSDDAFIITVQSVPAGFRVELSSDFGEHYLELDPLASGIIIPVAYRASRTFLVRVTAPAGLEILSGFDTVIRATSTIDPTVTNETVDRLYTTFIRLNKTVRVAGTQGTEGVASAAPGSEIEFAITYTNISAAGGTGNALLTAYNLVINENGNAAPNSWGTTTEHVVGATDNRGGYIVGDREGSTALAATINSLAAGQSGVFKFRRRIK